MYDISEVTDARRCFSLLKCWRGKAVSLKSRKETLKKRKVAM